MGFELWIEERDKAVWHLATSRSGRRRWQVACGWEMTPADSRIYPKKHAEAGPAAEDRCRTCVARPTAIPIDARDPASTAKP